MVTKNSEGFPMWRCSGALISETIFLTAGHCVEPPAVKVEIWFDADVDSGIPGNGYPIDASLPFKGQASGMPYLHPDYDPDAFFLYDLGVVVLDTPHTLGAYGVLPTLNQLDALKKRPPALFTAVGYGLQIIKPVKSQIENERVRMVAYPHLIQVNTGLVGDFSLLLSNNHATGGVCFGDSGGPNFLRDTNVIAGVTSFSLNGNCAGTGGVYRVDRKDDLDWLCQDFDMCSR